VIASTFIGGWRTLVLALLLTSSSALALAQDQAADTPSASSADASGVENAFTSASFDVAPSDVRVDLVAVRDVGEPRVRTEPGFVRVWFDDMTGWTTLDLDGDGGAIRFVRARQGAGDSSVVILRVGDGRRVPETSVHVAHTGTRVSIAIARDALPAARVSGSHAVATATPSEADVTMETEIEAPLDTATSLAASSGAADLLRDRALEAEREASSLGLAETDRTGHLVSLLAVTAFLLLALGAVRLWQSRRATKGLEPSIRIIAATRLSPKQQLVVVRALGQDHLLAIEPGRTERLISITTPTETAPEEPVLELRLSRDPGASPAASNISQALSAMPLAQAAQAATAPTLFARTLAALGLGPRPQAPPPISPLAHAAFAAMAPTSMAPAPMSLPPGAMAPQAAQAYASTQFGRELARLVESRSEAPLAPSTSMPPSSGSAVAGLVRLRAQAQAGRA
jgi:flagellar biogenesis protein FliO